MGPAKVVSQLVTIITQLELCSSMDAESLFRAAVSLYLLQYLKYSRNFVNFGHMNEYRVKETLLTYPKRYKLTRIN